MIRYVIHLWNAHKCEHVIHQSFGKHPGPHPPWTWLHELLWQDHVWPLLTAPTSIGCTIKTWLAALLWERSELSVYSSGSFPWSHLRLKISRVDFGILPTCTVRCYRASNSQPPSGWKQYNTVNNSTILCPVQWDLCHWPTLPRTTATSVARPRTESAWSKFNDFWDLAELNQTLVNLGTLAC